MTAVDPRSRFAARRAVARWAVRLFRRDWRQQALILALLTFALTVAVFGVAAGFNVVPTRDGEFGTANHRLRFRASDIASVEDQITALAGWFGAIEVIGHRDVRVTGSADRLELRAQDPEGLFSEPMLRLNDGRFPARPGEVAVTDRAAELLGADIGASAQVDGSIVTVVGRVENPAKLDDEFVLAPKDQIAGAQAYTVLVTTTQERAADLPTSVTVGAIERRPACHATLICLSAGQSEQTTAATGALGLATLLLLLVALVAAAGFVVVAQRRLRQLGMLAANGATDRHLRLVVLTNGAVVGSLAALLGAVGGIAGWVLAAPSFEQAAGHRIDRLHLLWSLIVATTVIAAATAVGAAWKPARAVARIPVMAALTARPPGPRPAGRSALIAVGLVAGGLVALSQAVDQTADHANPPLLIGGIVALVIGVVSITPAVLSGLGRLAGRAPLAWRIALRDLARYRARSSAALAAITLALAIPIAIVVVASAAEHGAGDGNLSDRQLVVRLGDDPLLVPERTGDELEELQDTVAKFAAEIGAEVTPLHVAVDARESTTRGADVLRPAVVLGRQVGENTLRDIGVLYVATPEVLGLLDLPTDGGDVDVDVLTPHTGPLGFANTADRDSRPVTTAIEATPYSSQPTSLLTTAGVQRRGWQVAPAGWVVEATGPITAEQLRALRGLAGAAGLTVEARDQQNELGRIRTAATAVGLLAALGVLGLTIGLLRVETSDDLRTLTAAGASRSVRRGLSAATGGSLAAVGVLLGTTTAYAGLTAGYADDLTDLSRVPFAHLVVLLVGLPGVSTAATWLVAGREPAALRRAPIE